MHYTYTHGKSLSLSLAKNAGRIISQRTGHDESFIQTLIAFAHNCDTVDELHDRATNDELTYDGLGLTWLGTRYLDSYRAIKNLSENDYFFGDTVIESQLSPPTKKFGQRFNRQSPGRNNY